MVAGGAMTIIGTVTGNQKLAKIGGLVSLAGGIGGLASGAWEKLSSDLASSSAAEASSAWDAAGSAAGSDAAQFAKYAAPGADTAASVAGAVGDTAGAAASASEGIISSNLGGMAEPLMAAESQLGSGLAGSADSAVSSAGPITEAAQVGAVSDLAAAQPSIAAPNVAAPSVPTVDGGAMDTAFGKYGNQAGPGVLDAQNAALSAAKNPAAPQGLWAKYGAPVAGFMNQNPGAAMVAGQALSGGAQGYMQQQAQKDAIAARTAELEAQRDRLNKSILALKMPTFQAPNKG
jgi:hypothetical protein